MLRVPEQPLQQSQRLGRNKFSTDFVARDVLDSRTHAVKNRIPMPNLGDSHGGVFVAYTPGPQGLKAEVVSDQNGLQGSALDASLKGAPWVIAGVR